MAADAARRRALLAAALQERRDDVQARLTAAADPAADPPAPDPEETLRVAMVRLWPAVARGGGDARALDDLAAALLSLADSARGDDLRFIDAYNNAFETMVDHPALIDRPAAQRLLATYSDLLSGHLERLTR